MNHIFRDFEKQSKKDHLHQIILDRFELFEVATEEGIQSLKKEYLDTKEKYDAEIAKIPLINEDNVADITADEWQLVEDVGDYYMHMDYSEQYLVSLLEMRIVYLFKNLEIVMKNMISVAYPNSNINDLYKWENMKTFFKSKGIELSQLDGYIECIDCRKVNNSIKHSEKVTSEIQKIKEFNNLDYFTSSSLEAFNARIRPKIEVFANNLRQYIEDDLFIFTQDRIDKIAKEYYDRMEEKDLKLLIKRLTDKL